MSKIYSPLKNILALPTSKGVEFIDTNTIIRIEAKSNYSKLHFDNGKSLLVAKVLSWFEGKLSADQFVRTHRTHFINKSFISFFKISTSKIELVTGEWIDVSRRKKHFFSTMMLNCTGRVETL